MLRRVVPVTFSPLSTHAAVDSHAVEQVLSHEYQSEPSTMIIQLTSL